MGVFSNKIEKDELKPGDHIYSWRIGYIYAHHGIYVGDNMVIHYTPGAVQDVGKGTVFDRLVFSSHLVPGIQCTQCGDQSTSIGVISSCIDCFLAGGNLRIYAYGVTYAVFIAQVRGGTCTLHISDPPEDVLHRARYLLQHGFRSYDTYRNNCEDFAIYCKTGKLPASNNGSLSGQIGSVRAAANAVCSSVRYLSCFSFTGLAVVTCNFYISRFQSDIGLRRDVIRIPVEDLVVEFSRSGKTAQAAA